MNLAHILVRVPEQTSDKEVAQLQARPSPFRNKAASGGATLPSWPNKIPDDKSTAQNGGVFGSRPH